MGIENRDYFRSDSDTRWSLAETPAVKFLLLVTCVIFLAQIFFLRDGRPTDFGLPDDDLTKEHFKAIRGQLPKVSVVQEWGELDLRRTIYGGQIWRLITHAFLHSRQGLFHILVNMALLFWFGKELELIYGSKEFLTFYLVSAVVAALTYVGMEFAMKSNGAAVGASGAVSAVMMLYTMHYPRHIIYVFFVLPLEMRWAMLLFTLYDLHPILLTLSGDRVFSGIAHAAHLGGVMFGFLYYHFDWRITRWLPGLSQTARKAEDKRPKPPNRPWNRTNTDEQNQLDLILEKIAREGMGSLTQAEKDALKAASDRIRRNRQ